MKLIFIGPQGSGKGTQAQILSKNLKIPHISIGDALRNTSGRLKEKVQKYMNQGELVPDKLIIKILKEKIKALEAKKGFILDGFPRSFQQLGLLNQTTKIDNIILIDISDREAIKRISGRVNCEKCKANYNLITSPKPKKLDICDVCGGKLVQRKDDTEQAVKKRLEIYHKQISPILKEYSNKNKLIKINGEQSIKKIAEDIQEKLKSKNNIIKNLLFS